MMGWLSKKPDDAYVKSLQAQRDRLWDENEHLKSGMEMIAALGLSILNGEVSINTKRDIDGNVTYIATEDGDDA